MAVAVEDGFDQYSAVSTLAIAGLLLGFLSIVGLLHPLLWLISLAAVAANLLALRRIAKSSPRLVGEKAALVGLALALTFTISAPIQGIIQRRDLRAQSVEIAEEWFTALRENHPESANRLSQHPTTRAARAQPALKLYEASNVPLQSLRKFVHESPVELLLKLGKRAHVRLYQNEEMWADQGAEGVRDLYVVTVGNPPQAKSFFIRLGTTRSRDMATGAWQWQVTKQEFVSVPSAALLDSLGG